MEHIKILNSATTESIKPMPLVASIVAASENLSTSFVEMDIPEELGSMLIKGTLTGESRGLVNQIAGTLTPLVRDLATELCGENVSENTIDIATQAGLVGSIMSANIPAAISKSINEGTTTEDVRAVGYDADAIRVQDLGKECFKSGIVENMVEHACRFNLRAVGPNAFVSAVAPIILFNPSESGLRCSIELIFIQDDITHKISGDVINFNRRTLVNAISDPTILGERSRKIVPIIRTGGGADDSTDKFLPTTNIAWWNETLDGTIHQTGMLATNVDINMIGIGQTDLMVSQSSASSSDMLNEVGNLSRLAVRLAAGIWLDIPVDQYSRSAFYKSHFGEATGMAVDLKATIGLTGDTALANGALLKTHIPMLDPLTNGGFEYRVFVRIGANGEADIQTGTTNVTGTSWNVVSIYDQNDNLLDPTDPNHVIIRIALEGASSQVAKCRIRGFLVDFTLANLNHKRRGDLIGKVIYTEEMWVPYLEPISCAREIGSTRDPEEVDTLTRIVHASMDNAAVDLLLTTSLRIQAWQDLATPDMLPETLGISRYVVTPTVISEAVDVATLVIGRSSSERHADISSVITNVLRSAVYRMWINSGMDDARSALGVDGRAETIVIAADPELAQYLYTVGDGRLFGNKFATKPVYSTNNRMKGKIFAFPSNPVVDNQCDCLRFAHTAYSPTTVMNLDLSIHGGAENVLSVYPRYRMFITNSVMVELDVSNIEAAYGPACAPLPCP